MNLRSYLEQQGIPFTWTHHDAAYTAQDLATKEHVRGWKVIKPVVVKADGQFVMCALPAPYYVDLAQLREQLDAEAAELAAEEKFTPLFGDCEPGAEPPIGSLFGLPTVMDDSLLGEEQLTFQAGTHEDAVTIRREDFIRLAHPKIAHFGKLRA